MIHRINPGKRVVFLPGIGIRVITPRSAAAAAASWWLAGGIDPANCIAAYRAKGAASLAASYDNLAAPGNGLADGTYDLTLGVAPTFDAATGWTFNGSTQWLTTAANSPIAGAAARTIAAFVNLIAAPAAYANIGPTGFGTGASNSNFELIINSSRRLYGWKVGDGDVSTTLTLATGSWYAVAFSYDGARCRVRLDASTKDGAGVTLATAATPFRIGKDASNRYGNFSQVCASTYNIELDDTQWAALAAAMAAL